MNETPSDSTAGSGFPAGFADLVQTGRQALASGDLKAARDIFVSVTQQHPDQAVGHNNLGGFYMGLGDHEAAAACFARALELAPVSLGTRFNLAVTQFGMGAYDAAAEGFAMVSAAAPEDPEALNNLGASRFLAGDHEAARTDLVAALTLNPNYPSALLNLCDVEQAAGNHVAAIELCLSYLAHHRDLGILRRLLELMDKSTGRSRTDQVDHGALQEQQTQSGLEVRSAEA